MRTLYTNAGFISTFISVRLQNCVICTVDGCFSVQDHQKSSIRFCTMYKRNVQIPIPFQASSTYFPALPSLCTDSPSATHGHQAGTVPAVGGVNYRLRSYLCRGGSLTRPSEIGDSCMLLPSAMWICFTNPPGGSLTLPYNWDTKRSFLLPVSS